MASTDCGSVALAGAREEFHIAWPHRAPAATTTHLCERRVASAGGVNIEASSEMRLKSRPDQASPNLSITALRRTRRQLSP
jgi:hypothetical protein